MPDITGGWTRDGRGTPVQFLGTCRRGYLSSRRWVPAPHASDNANHPFGLAPLCKSTNTGCSVAAASAAEEDELPR
jgi:hypothetical protein